MKEYVAYAGNRFIIEWYYDDRGKSSAFKYYLSLPSEDRIKILQLFKRMGDAGEIKDKTKFNYEGVQIYAFKPFSNRFLCFFYCGQKMVVTNAYQKKQQKLPKNEKLRSIKSKVDYEDRVKRGEYYE